MNCNIAGLIAIGFVSPNLHAQPAKPVEFEVATTKPSDLNQRGRMVNVQPGGGPGKPEVSNPEFSGPSIFTALQEQLGLKLEAQKAPVSVLVIQHVEKPSAN